VRHGGKFAISWDDATTPRGAQRTGNKLGNRLRRLARRRSDPATTHLPVVMVTTLDQPEDRKIRALDVDYRKAIAGGTAKAQVPRQEGRPQPGRLGRLRDPL
jgi:hypothetical protein